MSSSTKKRSSAKALHIILLRCLILLALMLLFGTLLLQIVNAALPAETPDRQQTLLGNPSRPFRFNKENLFPFLLAPMLFEVVCFLYLKRFFSRNGISAMDHISYFKRHPRTTYGRKFFTLFAWSSGIISIILSFVCHVLQSVSEAWFGTVVVIGTSILLCHSAKLLRHTRRQYFAHRHPRVNGSDEK